MTAAPVSYPTQVPVQVPVQTPTPVQTAAPADPYFVSSGSMNTQYNAPQQSNFYTNDQPAQVYTPAPAVIPTTPMPSQTVAPAPAVSTPAPAQTAAPAYDRVSAPTPTPAVSEAQPVLTAAPAPMLSMTAPAAPAASEAQSAPAALPAVEQAAPAAAPVVETEAPAEESGMLSFSLFSEIGSLLGSGSDALTESKLTSQEQTLLSAAPPDSLAEDAPPLTVEDGTETAVPEAPPLSAPALGADEAAPAEDAAEAPAAAKPEEEKLSIYDKTLRAQLLAMLGSSEDSLPEAELTRLVHVKLTPPDEYAGEEQVDICIYGDFIFYRRTASDGTVRTYRADCSLRDLDSFLQSCKTAAATPTPAPTLDPYMAAPAPTPEPSPEASAEASPEPTAP